MRTQNLPKTIIRCKHGPVRYYSTDLDRAAQIKRVVGDKAKSLSAAAALEFILDIIRQFAVSFREIMTLSAASG